MSENTREADSKINTRLKDLLEYVLHVGPDKKPIFKIEEYKQLNIWEHELKGKIGIQHNIVYDDGISIWLQIERLKRKAPPPIPEAVQEWITVGNDPKSSPQIKKELIKTLPKREVKNLVDKGVVSESDVTTPLKEQDSKIKEVNVTFRLENNSQAKEDIDNYVNEKWLPWSKEEKPRRETIKIYESLFSLQQIIEAQGEEQPVELIWGIGISRWLCEGHEIDYPLIEKAIEIEVSSKDRAISISPRNAAPTLAKGPYSALDNPGVDVLSHFWEKHPSKMSEDIEFSPYIHESFEPVLRQAAAHLSESGTYWPEANPNKENRKPNKIGESLEITDSWVIFARPRSSTGLIQDIKRFQANLEGLKDTQGQMPNLAKKLVTELSDKKPLQTSGGLSGGEPPSSSDSSSKTKQKPELFFPKVYNESQEKIIDRLEENDGVVVQGPPGTGKTHTIANIICHYLATGRSVLVTSKGESALSVLQEQIPEELRNLTISLLANERQGMKQLSTAIEHLASLVSQTNLKELNLEAASNKLRVKQLKKEIVQIDREIKEWGLKQVNPVGQRLTDILNMTAMQLAQQVIEENNDGKHNWLTDELGSFEKYAPQFNDSDIAKIRDARRKVGKYIIYVGKSIPNTQDLPDSANIVAIHDGLAKSAQIAESSKNNHIPPLAVSVEQAVERATKLTKPLQTLSSLLTSFESNLWVKHLFDFWLENLPSSDEKTSLINKLSALWSSLIERRQQFIRTLVEVPEPFAYFEKVQEALTNLVNNKRAFNIFSLGNKEAKNIIEQARIEGERPKDTNMWQLVLDYINYQNDMRKFIKKWNHAREEIELPKFEYRYGYLLKDVQPIYDLISDAQSTAKRWHFLKKEIIELFPHGIDVSQMVQSQEEIKKTIQAIEMNTERIHLGGQGIKLQDLMKKLNKSDGDIANEIKIFIKNTMGNPECSSDSIMQKWQELTSRLSNLNKLSSCFQEIENIADKIIESGAPIWAKNLKTEPLFEVDDYLTPNDWSKTWRWNQQRQYLHEIDGRERLKQLSEERVALDYDLRRTFSELVRLKTIIGLQTSMTERVQSALTCFRLAVAKIGKGTGKRAPRHRRAAYQAMQDCYGGVPCWIMPTWRVSENFPSDFGSFDLVIIDEASQSDITALPTILRGKKLLVVGDDKQVSPTANFVTEKKILQLRHDFLGDQPFKDSLLPGSSIYDLASVVFPAQRIMLTEHFRCAEPIIRFSMQFYNEPLIPLRIPKLSEELTPLIDVYVRGGHRDERSGINEYEAEAIVVEIKKLISDQKYKGRSIGVISLIGSHQAKYIQDQLLSELGDGVFQEYKIACGDASTFQGKERDIMFLSMVVGDGQGAVMIKRDAEQRMNVALSRARDRMYLYRSVQEEDFSNESDLRLKILRHFLSPMPQDEHAGNLIDLCDSNFERDVYTRLIKKGYIVRPQVRVGAFSIDLVVEGENDRRLAIELDGDKHHPPEKWEADWKRQRIMERVGWKFWRCWGSSYTIDPEGCMSDLISVLDGMQIFPCGSSVRANIYTEYREYEREIKEENDAPNLFSAVN